MIILRISGNLFRLMQSDLRRAHAFAAERVGFLFVRRASLPEGGSLLLSAEYLPVPDDDYLDDLTVGARINGKAIRAAMQKVLDTRQGCFHVHLHEHNGKPRFSGTDTKDSRTLIPTFQKVGKADIHGALVLSETSAAAIVLAPGAQRLDQQVRITILDQPMRIV